ncbi:MAG: AI-2E family transporter [Prolixibacteraceae bacterium]|nr:AI-2E family transporter [Prolixibacteraceae bacterium]
MTKVHGTAKNIFIIVGVILTLFLLWYFSSILAYVIISAIVSSIGRPVVRFLQRIKISHFHFSSGTCAMITLLLFWSFFISFFSFLIPLIGSEFKEFSTIDMSVVLTEIETPVEKVMAFFGVHYNNIDNYDVWGILKDWLTTHSVFLNLTDTFSTIAGAVGNVLIGFFSVSFISFFFLRDEKMFKNGILLLTPRRYEERVVRILISTGNLLKRYFIGLFFEVLMVGILITAGMSILGVGFHHAVIIGLLCGLFNIIPYLGPWMGAIVALLIGVAINLNSDFMSVTFPLMGGIVIIVAVVQLIDNMLFQPLIYSNSVKAHPLEIFLVIIIAGTLGGIVGMIIAIPVYTILRVVAREFLNNLKIVKALTKNLG